jgi:hypothetical protein
MFVLYNGLNQLDWRKWRMETKGNTLAIVLLVVGLVVGAGAGFFLTPSESSNTAPQSQPSQIQPIQPQPTQPTQQGAVEEKLNSIETLILAGIGAALVSALASIVTLMQISRRFSG